MSLSSVHRVDISGGCSRDAVVVSLVLQRTAVCAVHSSHIGNCDWIIPTHSVDQSQATVPSLLVAMVTNRVRAFDAAETTKQTAERKNAILIAWWTPCRIQYSILQNGSNENPARCKIHTQMMNCSISVCATCTFLFASVEFAQQNHRKIANINAEENVSSNSTFFCLDFHLRVLLFLFSLRNRQNGGFHYSHRTLSTRDALADCVYFNMYDACM